MRLLALAAVAATAAACALAAAPAAAQEPTTMVVVETAGVRAVPDTATVAATIRRRAGRAAVARRRVERRVAEVLRALDALGVPRADVRTSSVRSFPTRRRGGRIEHVATTSLRIRTTQLDKVGRIVRALGGAHVEGPDFDVVDSTAARQEATRIALARARARADAAAAALGMRVLGIRRVDLNPEFGYDPDLPDAAMGGGGGGQDEAGSAPVTIVPGEDEVVVAVAVVYDVGP